MKVLTTFLVIITSPNYDPAKPDGRFAARPTAANAPAKGKQKE